MIKNVRSLLSVTLSVLAILTFGGMKTFGETPSDELLHAARLGLIQFVDAHRESSGDPAAKFISSLEGGVVTYGFPVYTVNPNSLLSRVDRPFEQLAQPTGIWRFIVEVNGQPSALITMEKVDNQWTAVNLGAAELAHEISFMNQLYLEKEGYSTRFFRVYQAKADFLQIVREGEVKGFAPFKSGRLALDVDNLLPPGGMITETELLLSLRDVIQENLSNDYLLLNQ